MPPPWSVIPGLPLSEAPDLCWVRCSLVEAVAFCPCQQGLQRVGGVVDALVQVAELGKAGGHRSDGELAWVDVVDLAPGNGGGHGRLRHAAHRVRTGDRVVAGVLVVVDKEHGGVAVLSPPGGCDMVRGAALDLAGEGMRGAADVGKAPPWLDPDVDVQAIATRSLGPAGHSEFAEYLVHDVS